jgi:hypothetical protein
MANTSSSASDRMLRSLMWFVTLKPARPALSTIACGARLDAAPAELIAIFFIAVPIKIWLLRRHGSALELANSRPQLDLSAIALAAAEERALKDGERYFDELHMVRFL